MYFLDKRRRLSNTQIKLLTEIWADIGEKNIARINGNSMWPLIKEGYELTIGHNLNVIRRGDVLIYRQNGVMIAHRVVKIINKGQNYYLTKGDCNRYFDQPMLTNEITLGKVIEVKGGGKKHNYESFFWRCINNLAALLSGLYVKPQK